MGRVFIIQNQMKRTPDNSGLVPRYEFSSATKFGKLTYLLGPNAGPFNPGSITKELREKLGDFDDGDYLLLVGNPCLIGWAVAIAADRNDGCVKLLQWGSGRYQPISVKNLFGDLE